MFEDLQSKQAKKIKYLKQKIQNKSDNLNDNGSSDNNSILRSTGFSPLSYFMKPESVNSEDEAKKHKRSISISPTLPKGCEIEK